MSRWGVLLLALGALLGRTQAEELKLSDYRVRGAMEYRGAVGDGAGSCENSWLAACARAGRLGLRTGSGSLRLLPPPSGFAVFSGKIVTCPEAVADVTTDNDGNNARADGVFDADPFLPNLIPVTPFAVVPGGGSNSIQLRTLGASNQCIYEFQLMQATNYILGVAPVEWVSIFSAAAHTAAPAAAAGLAALAAACLLLG